MEVDVGGAGDSYQLSALSHRLSAIGFSSRFPVPHRMALVLFALAAASFPSDPQTYNGREGRLDVAPPRVQAEVTIDGRLDEPVWGQAARLTGFSLYAPVDGRAAPDSTEVFVWYSSKA